MFMKKVVEEISKKLPIIIQRREQSFINLRSGIILLIFTILITRISDLFGIIWNLFYSDLSTAIFKILIDILFIVILFNWFVFTFKKDELLE
jgi:hypothetical protein